MPGIWSKAQPTVKFVEMKNRFNLRISAEEMQRYYKGHAKTVVVRADSGQTLQFSADHLRTFVQRDGVAGWFEIEYDTAGKFVSLNCLKRL